MLEVSRWNALLRRMSLDENREAFEGLLGLLAESHRTYHNAEHVADCLTQLDTCDDSRKKRDEVELALWLHDAIYDPRRSDNEERSAELSQAIIEECGGEPELVADVRRLILATRHNAVPLHDDEHLITDIDLSILGRERDVFDRYDAAIRSEYSWVPSSEYRAKRLQVLKSFLGRSNIYQTKWFREHFELQARDNLRRANHSLENTGDNS